MTYSSPARAPSSLGENASHAPASSSELSSPRRLGVLGIGLIMEEVGKGARLVFRYPASPLPFFGAPEGESDGGGSPGHPLRGNKSPRNNAAKSKGELPVGGPSSNGGSGDDSNSSDLFFDLPARVLSKLFRPKRPLCGQPLTLNVSGTTFCCRAELFDSQKPSTIGGGEESNHPLVLFSVIVALAPLAPSASAKERAQSHSTQYPFDFIDAHNENSHVNHSSSSSSTQNRSDSVFRTITSVHRNLARLCRVLVREEYRCRYVSRQCSMLLQIRSDYISSSASSSSSSNSDGGGSNCATLGVDASSKKGEGMSGIPPPPISPNASLAKGKDASKTKVSVSDDQSFDRPEMSRSQRREYVQNLIEIMLAASPPVDRSRADGSCDGKDQHGNLARELAHVFHWISSPSTGQGVLSRATATDGVVYINRHIAVPLDPVDAESLHHLAETKRQHPVRPYHTLLFPNSSPSEVLKGLTDGVSEMANSPSTSKSLRRILPYIQPRKSLLEISLDSGLSLPHVMDAANLLLHAGICVRAMPVLRKGRYACADGVVPKMSSLALPFWQTFGAKSRRCKFHWGGDGTSSLSDIGDATIPRKRTVTSGCPHIFVIVSALTTSKTEDGSTITQNGAKANASASPKLGDAIDLLSGVDEPTLGALSPQYKHPDSFQYGENRHDVPRPLSGNNLASMGLVLPTNQLHLNRSTSRGGAGAGTNTGSMEATTEEIVYAMAVWLIAQEIIVEVKDFLVAVESSRVKNSGGEADTISSEESLYNELLQCRCLDGTTSIPAICYGFGLDRTRMEKFICWGQHTDRFEVVRRIEDNGHG